MKPTAVFAAAKRARRGRKAMDDTLPTAESICEDLGSARCSQGVPNRDPQPHAGPGVTEACV